METKHSDFRHITSASVIKAGLAVLFLFSAVLTGLGFWGKNISETSGFRSSESCRAIYLLSEDMNSIWNEAILPSLKQLEETERKAVDEVTGRFYSEQM